MARRRRCTLPHPSPAHPAPAFALTLSRHRVWEEEPDGDERKVGAHCAHTSLPCARPGAATTRCRAWRARQPTAGSAPPRPGNRHPYRRLVPAFALPHDGPLAHACPPPVAAQGVALRCVACSALLINAHAFRAHVQSKVRRGARSRGAARRSPRLDPLCSSAGRRPRNAGACALSPRPHKHTNTHQHTHTRNIQ